MDEKEEDRRALEILREKGMRTILIPGTNITFLTGDRYFDVNPDSDDLLIFDQARQGKLTTLGMDDKRLTSKQRRERLRRMRREVPQSTPELSVQDFSAEADGTWNLFWQHAVGISMWEAIEVKRLRGVERRSWRNVARQFKTVSMTAGWYAGANQIAGMAVCRAAAQKLGEDWEKDPWN